MADVTNGAVNTNSAAVSAITLDKTKSLSATASASNPATINNASNTGGSVELFNNSCGNQNGNNGPSEFAIDQNNKSPMGPRHPSLHLSRKETTDIQRQNVNLRMEYSESIDFYLRELEE